MSDFRPRHVEHAITRAVDTLVDRLLTATHHDEALDAFDQVLPDILDSTAHHLLDGLTSTEAMLDDGTWLRFETDMVRVPWLLQARQMLGIKTRVADLPAICTRGARPTIQTMSGSQVWTWPIASYDGHLVPVLRSANDGHPVLVTADGISLWSPGDAAVHHDGVLLDGPTVRVTLTADGPPLVEDTEPGPEPETPETLGATDDPHDADHLLPADQAA